MTSPTCPKGNVTTVTCVEDLVKILNGNPQELIASSYELDHHWIKQMFGPTRYVWIENRNNQSLDKNTTEEIFLYPKTESGAMNAKFMILMYSSHIRLVVSTANWKEVEFDNFQTVIYYQDFIQRNETNSLILGPFLNDLGVPKETIDRLLNYDYTNSLGSLVVSKPGIHHSNYGLHAIPSLIESMCLPRDNLTTYYQTTNLGFLNRDWYGFTKRIFTPGNDSKYAVVYPCFSTVKKLRVKRSQTELLRSNINFWKENKYYKDGLLDCVPKTGKMLNSNMIICCAFDLDTPFTLGGTFPDGYLFFGSFQSTRLSWGRPDHDGLVIKNWELGIMFPIKKSKSTDEGFKVPFLVRPYKLTDEPFEYIAHSHKLPQKSIEEMPASCQINATYNCCICWKPIYQEGSNCVRGHSFHTNCLNIAFLDPHFNHSCPRCKVSLPRLPKVIRPTKRATFLADLTTDLFQTFLDRLLVERTVDIVRKRLHFKQPAKEALPLAPMTIFFTLEPVRIFGYLIHYPELAFLRDENGSGPLHWASKLGKFDICLLLIRFGAELEHQDLFGCVPIYRAAQYGHFQVVKLLFKECPKAATILDLKGMKAIDAAQKKGHMEIVQYLKSKEPKINL